MIASGALDHRLQIMVLTSSTGETGQVVEAYCLAGSTYAQRLELRTVDAARAGMRDTYAIARFLIRYRTDLTTSHRVQCDGKTYSVLAIDEPDRRATLVLTCEEVTL